MKKIWIGILIIAVLAIASMLIVIQPKEEPEVIKIGSILPLTGPGAMYGEKDKMGMDLAVELINQKNGINGKMLKIIYEDSKTDPSQGVSAAQKLIKTDKINIIIGALASSVSLAIAPIANKNKVILISPGSSSPKLSEAGEYIFRIYPSDDYQGKILAEIAVEEMNCSRIAILYVNNDYGGGLRNEFSETVNMKDGEIIISEAYNPEDLDIKTQITKIKSKNPEAVFIVAQGEEYINILKQFKELNFNTKIIAPDSFYDKSIIKKLGDAAEDIICTVPSFDSTSSDPTIQKFVSEFENKYNKKPSSFSAYGYDAVMLISELLKMTYNNDIDNKKDALYKIKYSGVTGMIKFDENGDAIKELDIYQVRENKFIKIN